ncbi:hypothetical protein CsatA_012484 [Cannabis sativa]
MKDGNWWDYQATNQESWYWKQIVAAKNQLKETIDTQHFAQRKYKISDGYELILPTQRRVTWSNEVWGRFNTPKHSFIEWLAVQKRLRTKDRLQRFQMLIDPSCSLCTQLLPETHDHLFFRCPFSAGCLKHVKEWLSWGACSSDLQQLLKWIHKAKISKFRKKVLAAAAAHLVYSIWHSRNDQIWNNHLEVQDVIVQRVKQNVKHRIELFWPKKIGPKDRDWFHSL